MYGILDMTNSSDAFSPYYKRDFIQSAVDRGTHRAIVGGMWEEVGQLQFDFLVENGLKPSHRLLDIGCGCLRGGVHFVRYLNPGNYYGIDINRSLLDAGYDIELAQAGLQERMPRDNLKCGTDFDFSVFAPVFDRALAVSVFTHLPLNTIRVCLERLAPKMTTGGVFYATFFELPDGIDTWRTYSHEPGGIVTQGNADRYHYRRRDMYYVAEDLPFKAAYIGSFKHPRAQHMMAYHRL